MYCLSKPFIGVIVTLQICNVISEYIAKRVPIVGVSFLNNSDKDQLVIYVLSFMLSSCMHLFDVFAGDNRPS